MTVDLEEAERIYLELKERYEIVRRELTLAKANLAKLRMAQRVAKPRPLTIEEQKEVWRNMPGVIRVNAPEED